jgi:DNA-binding beta-propeller fold protein YncE
MLLAFGLAAAYVSVGFVSLPPNVEIGAMSAVALDARDNIYVLHRGPQPLLKLDQHGKFVKAWGEGLFKVAHGLRIDRAGNIWTTDNGNHLLRKFSPGGELLASIGEGMFKAPDDVVFASDGSLFVADSGNSRIAHVTADGKLLGSFGQKGKAEGEFATAHALAIDGKDRVYVADRGNRRVQVLSKDGKVAAVWTGFGEPFGLIVVKNELLVSDGDAHTISHLALSSGKMAAQWGDPKSLLLPHLMATDSKGRLYVAEVNGKRVQIFQRNK